jgi:hypothetical protein
MGKFPEQYACSILDSLANVTEPLHAELNVFQGSARGWKLKVFSIQSQQFLS